MIYLHKAAQKRKPKSTSFSAMKAELESIAAQRAEAERNLKYWQDVQNAYQEARNRAISAQEQARQELEEVSSSERAEMESRIIDWLSEENLALAIGKTREEIFNEFGNELMPIAYIPAKNLIYVSPTITDPRIYCGKGYFIDHALRNHGKKNTQVSIDDIDVSKYLNIQAVLDSPDHIKEILVDGKRTVVFIKKIGRYFAELTQVEEDGKIVLHKSFFNQKKEPYIKLNDIRQDNPSPEVGTPSISHSDNSEPAISLQSRDDVISSEAKDSR